MAIDTRDKRSSAVLPNIPFRNMYPNPDGSLAIQADRQHIDRIYRGILASGAPASNSLIPIIRIQGSAGSLGR